MAFIVYLDESQSQAGRAYVLSALAIPEDTWNAAFNALKTFRLNLKSRYGIPLRSELHWRDFVAARGSAARSLRKWQCARVFREYLQCMATELPGLNAFAINACLSSKPNPDALAIDRIGNRLQRTLERKAARAILVFDQGHDDLVRKTVRRMRVYNPIPSQFGSWGEGSTRNIQIDRIIGDVFFRDSKHDLFIQAVDAMAYALLKQECPDSKRIVEYGIHKTFRLLDPLLLKAATQYDKQGVLRR